MMVGLSATVARASELRGYLMPQNDPDTVTLLSDLVTVEGGAKPQISILEVEDEIPWSGHTARYAMHKVYDAIRAHKLTLVFVNARLQAEVAFQELWRINDDNLPIGLHHGSLDAFQRRKVEAAMAAGKLRAVVATSTLDLGIDWGDVDLVIHLGAPKGASRFLQRIGRSNHRMDEPSRGILVPGNRFEVLECRAAQQAAEVGAQDAILSRSGALDVLAQHILGMACQAPFDPADLFAEVRSALPYAGLRRNQFDRAIDFVSTGGYALKNYERFAKLKPSENGKLRVSNPRIAQQYRLNVGTIVDFPMLKVRLVSGAPQCWTRATRRSRPRRDRRIFCRTVAARRRPSSLRVRFSASKACATPKSSFRAHRRKIRWCRVTAATNSRSRRISPLASERCSPTQATGQDCHRPSLIG